MIDRLLFRPLFVLMLGLGIGVPHIAAADEYRVIPGDILRVSHVDVERIEEVSVDLDGRIRVTSIGSVMVAGLTLDEIEDNIDAEIANEGLILGLESTVSIGSYAPIVVMGDVSRPGRFDYIPGMGVATALGLSGGSRALAGVDPLQLERAASEVAGQVRVTGLEIAGSAALIARLEAARDGEQTLEMAPALRDSVPAADRGRIDELLALEAEILRNAQDRAEEQMRLWNNEIVSLEEQGDILSARIVVQNDIVAQAAANLETALQLQERGLQTSNTMTRVQQAEADARARALELESLGLSIQRNLSEARRAQSRFLRNQTEETLAQLQTARARHQDAMIRHARAIEQQAILQGGNLATLISSEAIQPDFRILRSRPDVPVPDQAGLETPLMPGDTLIVTMDVAVPQDG